MLHLIQARKQKEGGNERTSSPSCVRLATNYVSAQVIGHVRYINILTWLRGFRVKLLYLVLFSLYSSLFWELRDKRNFNNLQFWPESLGAMLEYWYIERGLLTVLWAEFVCEASKFFQHCFLETIFIRRGHFKDDFQCVLPSLRILMFINIKPAHSMECESMLFVKNHIPYVCDLSNSFSNSFVDF